MTFAFVWDSFMFFFDSILFAGFLFSYVMTKEKSSFWLMLGVLLGLLTTEMEGVSSFTGSFVLSYFNWAFLLTLLIQLVRTFIASRIIVTLGRIETTKRTVWLLVGYMLLIVAFAIPVETRGVYHFLLYLINAWGIVRLFPLRKRDLHTALFLAALISILCLQMCNIFSYFITAPPSIDERSLLQRQNRDLFYVMNSVGFVWKALELRYQIVCIFRKRKSTVSTSFQGREERIKALAGDNHLTTRETEILTMLLDGMSNREIAEKTYTAEGTVKTHIHNIYGKLGVSRRTQVMALFNTDE